MGWSGLKKMLQDEMTRFEIRYFNRSRRLSDPIFFIHLPKTAGTSFRIMLFRKIRQDEIFPNWEDIQSYGGKYPDISQAQQFIQHHFREQIKLFVGHYPFAFRERLPVPFKIITFVREPVDRTISNLRHFKRSKVEDKDLSLSEIFEKYKTHLANFQTRYLSDPMMSRDMYYYNHKPMDKRALDQAKAHLADCDLVGVTERFEESVRLAESILGFSLGNPLKENSSAGKAASQIDPELIATLRLHLKLDLALYDYALQLFDRKVQSILKQ